LPVLCVQVVFADLNRHLAVLKQDLQLHSNNRL